MKPALLVQGMHGLGDNLHQRAVLRQLMQRHNVWLESSWVAPYHDLVADGLKVIGKPTQLRTQTKNARREAGGFSRSGPPAGARRLQVSYRPDRVRALGSVLAAMCEQCGVDHGTADFRLPVPGAWIEAARVAVGYPERPIMLYRPLVERKEWGGCAARNPDHAAYATLFRSIRDRFFVVSVADLVPRVEWMVGERVEADLEFHAGELPFEALAGLAAISGLVFTAPGFAVVLAQAVWTPVTAVFGGYERGYSFSSGGRVSPYLPIEPMVGCDCFRHNHACDKRIDVDAAMRDLAAFTARQSEELRTNSNRPKLFVRHGGGAVIRQKGETTL